MEPKNFILVHIDGNLGNDYVNNLKWRENTPEQQNIYNRQRLKAIYEKVRNGVKAEEPEDIEEMVIIPNPINEIPNDPLLLCVIEKLNKNTDYGNSK